ncbi:BlaI/MecI/CopY family transcriptional regulator [Candidatus Sumerlaeota bacterium]|nr:BlaI/MecI/CopY family transcriptional regulator [Candidatus Sumerlaeota bacterium]
MLPKKRSKPTEAELAILRVLWEHGSRTVRQVHENLSPEGETSYTTTLKLMQIMTEKGLVERDETRRTHIYRPCATREKTQRQLVGDLIDRAFGGSTQGLILQALSSRQASPEELAEIRRLLEQMDQGDEPS